MNKSAIRNFAMRARNNLMAAVEQKAFEIGITKNGIKDIETFQGGFRVNDRVFKASEVEQRKKLIQKIREKGFDQVIEEVAYTWFNRFIALRFMEVNEYLPTGVRVLSSTDTNKTEPDIIREALNIELDIDKNVVYQYQDKNDTEGLFKYLLIKQCNELAKIMPVMFEEIEDYTELLLPDHLLTEGSVIRDLVESIEEEDFKEQVEIIGWLYQYYISEKHDEVVGINNGVIKKEDIPAATQLFTPDWIVKYMVQNSLGKYWIDHLSESEVKREWEFYLGEPEQKTDVKNTLNIIRQNSINPEDIKVLDPAMGSGHILVYAFDVLYDIYKISGYSERDIPKLILEKNLYGLDIDDRAGQLAYFALMMKARSKSRRIFRERIELNICSIQESNSISEEAIDLLVNNVTELEKTRLRQDLKYLIDVFCDAKEYGAILYVKNIALDMIEKALKKFQTDFYGDLFEYQFRNQIITIIPQLIKQAKIFSQQYDVVISNPPYMSNFDSKLKEFVETNFSYFKKDLFSVFIKRNLDFSKENGYCAFMTPLVWMFINTYEEMRRYLIEHKSICSLIELEYSGFEEATVPICTFVLNNSQQNYIGTYIKLSDFKGPKIQPVKVLEAVENTNVNYRYKYAMEYFGNIMGSPIAYWIPSKIFETSNKTIGDIYKTYAGISTGCNERFIRYWHEVNFKKVKFNKDDVEFSFVPHVKGGEFKKWYGNRDYVLYYNEKAKNEMMKLPGFRHDGREKYFLHLFSWSKITSSSFSIRYYEDIFSFDSAAPVFALENPNFHLLGFLNSKVSAFFLKAINPTLNFPPGYIQKIPYIECNDDMIENKVKECISITRKNWDSFETSWDFTRHPLLKGTISNNLIESAYADWKVFLNNQFEEIKEHEQDINRVFINIYGLQDELSPNVEEKNITLIQADSVRDIKSLISYAIGCMFGRYSLDEDGLVYAGGKFNEDRYRTINPVKDNIIPIVEDVYFEEDIMSRFIDFVKVTFGKDTLEENLDYIAEMLNKKPSETSRQTIRRYFLNDFYKDHVQMYKKRPIYWLFDSGKQDGFKALIYMHRYDPYTVARVRTDYLHKLQKKYDAEINRLDIVLESNVSQAEKTKARKKKEDLIKKMQECTVYDQAIAHVANQKIEIDLDDGVAVNYAKFQGVEIPQGEGKKPLKADLLAKI